MPTRTPPPGQLDIPLIWEHEEGGPPMDREDPVTAPRRLTPLGGTWRLWFSALADTGMLVLAVAGSWGLAAALGAELNAGQLVVAGLAGLETASIVAVGCLWGWRASPGMLLARICFSRPIPWGRVCRLWLYWLLSLVVAGVPLLLRHKGESMAERLADGSLSFRSLPEGA
jgi:hypothetical protein